MCKQKPITQYNFPKDQEIYATTRIRFPSSSGISSTANIKPSGTANAASSSTTHVVSSSTTYVASSSRTPSPASSGLSKGVIAAIVLVGLLIIIVILGSALLIHLRRKDESKAEMRIAAKPQPVEVEQTARVEMYTRKSRTALYTRRSATELYAPLSYEGARF